MGQGGTSEDKEVSGGGTAGDLVEGISEGKTDYWDIGLVEVMWKVVAAILNRRLTASITFHDFLHGLRAGRRTGTAALEAKLLQQLAALREEVMYVIFLDLQKAYDALDRSR